MFGPENFIIVASIITFLLWTIWHVSDLVNLAINQKNITALFYLLKKDVAFTQENLQQAFA
jgi:Na+/alanine symporter